MGAKAQVQGHCKLVSMPVAFGYIWGIHGHILSSKTHPVFASPLLL